MIKRTIYPEVSITEMGEHIKLCTSLRKLQEGEWYFVDFMERGQYIDEIGKRKVFERLRRNVYLFSILGVIDLKFKRRDESGQEFSLYEKDISQISETERLEYLYCIHD